MWLSPSARTIDKDCVKKPVLTLQNQEAVKLSLSQKKKKWAMRLINKVKFNCAYYLAKHVRPYSDYPIPLSLHGNNRVKVGTSYLNDHAATNFTDHIAEVTRESLQKDVAKANFYSLLNDGSTDSGVIEQELICSFLNEGIPTPKYFSIESLSNADAEGIKEAIKTAFARFGISNFTSHLLGLNVDGASVNMGIHRGLGILTKQEAPWLSLVQCFNHKVELAIKDSFANSSFTSADDLLTKFCYLYEKTPKCLRELKLWPRQSTKLSQNLLA